MRIVQNFSSKKHIKELPLFDIMIWYVGLSHYKQLGYDLKLYCEASDIPFLKKWHLYDFYDEIDMEFLAKLPNDCRFKKIDGVNFWSVRKLFCIENEFRISDEQFIYSDTDIVLYSEISPLDKMDMLVWTIEHENIYIDWRLMSVPDGYKLPAYLEKIYDAYNCGLMWFKDYARFNAYFNEYIKFTSGNPCVLDARVTNDPMIIKNIWACNAEQRILFGVAEANAWNVGAYMLESDIGIDGFCEGGIHYYLLRGALRQLAGDDSDSFWLGLLTNQAMYLLDEIKDTDESLFGQFMERDELRDAYEKGTQLAEYI